MRNKQATLHTHTHPHKIETVWYRHFTRSQNVLFPEIVAAGVCMWKYPCFQNNHFVSTQWHILTQNPTLVHTHTQNTYAPIPNIFRKIHTHKVCYSIHKDSLILFSFEMNAESKLAKIYQWLTLPLPCMKTESTAKYPYSREAASSIINIPSMTFPRHEEEKPDTRIYTDKNDKAVVHIRSTSCIYICSVLRCRSRIQF